MQIIKGQGDSKGRVISLNPSPTKEKKKLKKMQILTPQLQRLRVSRTGVEPKGLSAFLSGTTGVSDVNNRRSHPSKTY